MVADRLANRLQLGLSGQPIIYSLFFIALIHLHPPPPPQNRFCILCITECIEGCRGSKRCIAHSPKLFSQVDILSYFLTVTAPTRNYCTYVFWCDKCAYFVLQFFFFIKGLPEYFFFKQATIPTNYALQVKNSILYSFYMTTIYPCASFKLHYIFGSGLESPLLGKYSKTLSLFKTYCRQ